ncbi:Uncharacterised protein [Streptococcus pneumoniae]|nr:Uncharacterised protein [Streptococcus pneumoniae]
MPLVARLITLKCLYLLFYLPIHKGFSLVEKLKNGRVSDLRLFVY